MPRTNDDIAQGTGVYKRQCPVCGKIFYTDISQAKYDTQECRRKATNARYYEVHRERIIRVNSETQRARMSPRLQFLMTRDAQGAPVFAKLKNKRGLEFPRQTRIIDVGDVRVCVLFAMNDAISDSDIVALATMLRQ